MADFNIERVGKPDLVFAGDLIGQSDGAQPKVRIYRTKSGKFIAEIAADTKRAVADHFEKPLDLVSWLRKRFGSLPQEAQTAIEGAARNDKSFKEFWTERVE